MQDNSQFFCAHALLPTGWASDVALSTNSRGQITRIATDAKPSAAAFQLGTTLPGMPNLHSHAFQRGMAGLTEHRGSTSDSFWTWRDVMYQFVDRLTPDDLHCIASYLYVDLLKHGYTSVGEFHYLHHQPGGTPYEDPTLLSQVVVEAAVELVLRITLLPTLYTSASFQRGPLTGSTSQQIPSP